MQLYLDKSEHIKPFLGIFAGVKAFGYVTFNTPASTDTVVVGANTYTKVAATPTGRQFVTIAQLAALILADGINAVSDGTVISLTYPSVGVVGNGIVLTRAGTGTLAVSGATLTGGVDADTSKDALLDMLNKEATSTINSIFGVSTFAYHTVTDELFEGAENKIFTKDYPIASVTTIKQGRLQTVYTQDEAYIIELDYILVDGVIYEGTGYDSSRVTYIAGYKTYGQTQAGGAHAGDEESMPEELKLATLIILAGLFNRRNNLGISQFSVQGKTVGLRTKLELEELDGIIVRRRRNNSYTT